MARRTFKRVVIISDTHCGHVVGLTPPDFPGFDKFEPARREYWNWFSDEIKALGKVDVLIHNGDAIDGKGKTGADEHITGNLDEQARIAEAVIKFIKAPQVVMTVGTEFHVGTNGILLEHHIAQRVGAVKIGNHEWVDINGLIFDLKHHIGSSSVPYARHTAVSRDAMWNKLYSEREWQPKAQVVIRSHVHYHQYAGLPGVLAMTTPALQGHGSRYGSLRCSGLVDYGFVHFDVEEDGSYSWQSHLADLPVQRAQALAL